MITERDTLIELNKLSSDQQWPELKQRAFVAVKDFPSNATMAAFVAHAMRKLDELDDGWTWACRAVELDEHNLFAVVRKSLLGVLTHHDAEVFALAKLHLDRDPATADEAHNLAITYVNAILAASRLGTIPEAVELFTPLIVRLDHDNLHYNSACLYALAGDVRVWTYAAKALSTLKTPADFGAPDFDSVRADPRFAELMARNWAAETAALQRASKELQRAATRDELRPEHFVDPAMFAHGAADRERNSELERAIDAAVDDPAGYLVYSDWLQERGNPRGLFALASRRSDEARGEGERMLAYVEWAAEVARHAGALLGGFAHELGRNCRLRWRHGVVAELVFDLGATRHDVDAAGLLQATLVLPAFRFVRALAIRDVPAEDGELDYAPIVDVLCGAELPQLRALAIEPRVFQISGTSLDASALGDAFPQLESLVVGAGRLELGHLDLPRLRRLAVHSGGLTRENFADVCSARVPELDDLEVWFGSVDYGGHKFSSTALAPLLNNRQSKLRRLGLMNAEFTSAMIEPLARSILLPQLTELDLAMGTMTDAGAELLVLHAAAFRHLAKLTVADNTISDAGCAALTAALPNIVTGDQKPTRYVSISE